MRIIKLEHAHLRVEQDDRVLLIDPGMFTADLGDLGAVTAVVLTHEHADHWTPEHLAALRAGAPDAPVLATAAIHAQAGDGVTVVQPGEVHEVGGWRLEFFGGTHAEIHSSIPLVDNVGVFVDDLLYYPGDSFAVPEGRRVPVLAAPVAAPWLKLGEAMDFVLDVAAEQVFGTHELTVSGFGLQMHHGRLAAMAEKAGGSYHALTVGDVLEVTG